jgi:hypothetical protein
MSTIGTNSEDLILNADGSGSDIKFKSNGTEVGSISDGGVMTATSFAGSGASLTGIEGVPSGVIAMWHGASGAIPSGWVICDGNNSTPNLTDKFIKSTGTANATGGGTTTGAHTLTIAEMPSHHHYYGDVTPNSSGTPKAVYGAYGAGQNTGNEGGGGSHTHTQSEPVYFSLIFIMKT